MLLYNLKVAVLLTVFYIFYRLLLSRETFHAMNRVVLMTTAMLSFVLPLCVITYHASRPVAAMPDVVVGELTPMVVEPVGPAVFPWVVLLVTVAVVRLLYVALSYVRLQRFIASCEHHPWYSGVLIAVTDRTDLSPFSWMKTIVLPRSDYEHWNQAVMTHEMGHIRRGHSWDVLLMELICSVQWFNPTVWMIRQDLRAIHEYEADEAVVKEGFNAHEYLDMLVTKAVGHGAYSMANGITNSTLKKRIQMMMKQKSFRWRSVKVLYVIPVIALSLACTSKPAVDTPDELTPETVVDSADDNALFIIDDQEVTRQNVLELKTEEIESISVIQGETAVKIYGDKGKNGVVYVTRKKVAVQPEEDGNDVADTMPEFPGGMAALTQWIGEHVQYPAEAKKEGLQGKVVVSFVVQADGTISDVEAIQKVSDVLDAEAVRVVKAMPKWTPGRQNGESVATKFAIPVYFRLE